MSKIEGGCLCGNVHYSSDAEPVMVAACHCTHCRKQSGTAYSMNIAVPAASVKLSGDALKTYVDAGTSGLKVLRNFCGNCGSPIASDIEAFPGLLFLKAGTLDDPSWVKPGAEIWCDSKLSWATLGSDLPSMPGNPPAG